MRRPKSHKPTTSVYLKTPSPTAVQVGHMDTITLEHVSELVTCHAELLAGLYAVPVEEIQLDYDLQEMVSFYQEFFSPSQFSNMFVTQPGRGYLIGFYSTMSSLRDGVIEVADGDN